MNLNNAIILAALCLLTIASCTHGQTIKNEDGIQINTNNPKTKLQTDIPAGLKFSWLEKYNPEHALLNVVPVPDSYNRIDTNGFGLWLRWLPIKTNDRDVTLYNGEEKVNQSAHYAIVNVDVGSRDLQQCADAVMRMRAEYQFVSKQENNIVFNFTSGHAAKWQEWKNGKRPLISGNNVSWVQKATEDGSYQNFKKYLNSVFTYAGTSSLSKEMEPVEFRDIQAGDVLIQGGFPGHAVLVLDLAVNSSGDKLFLLGQSYMPAQEFHVLKNPTNPEISPWYSVNDFDSKIPTPEWRFTTQDLKRFKN